MTPSPRAKEYFILSGWLKAFRDSLFIIFGRTISGSLCLSIIYWALPSDLYDGGTSSGCQPNTWGEWGFASLERVDHQCCVTNWLYLGRIKERTWEDQLSIFPASLLREPFRGLKFLAAAGYNFDRDDLNDVEVVQLVFGDNVTLPVCENLPPFPVYTRGNPVWDEQTISSQVLVLRRQHQWVKVKGSNPVRDLIKLITD